LIGEIQRQAPGHLTNVVFIHHIIVVSMSGFLGIFYLLIHSLLVNEKGEREREREKKKKEEKKGKEASAHLPRQFIRF
jgi:hypothetical protein